MSSSVASAACGREAQPIRVSINTNGKNFDGNGFDMADLNIAGALGESGAHCADGDVIGRRRDVRKCQAV